MGILDVLIVSIFGLAIITSQMPMPTKKEEPNPPTKEITAEDIMKSIAIDKLHIKRILIEAEITKPDE